ncbi:MAG: vitamin B12-dependent ribonucleotide reductase [Ignavibacteria bacterium]|nr:vitamin B12-dependent ribonucleotide reductase [Ignavibacteria bacterium]
MSTRKIDLPNTESEEYFKKDGLTFNYKLSNKEIHPFDEIEWDLRDATISNEKGEIIFQQKDVEIPKSWSLTATNVVVSKYFHGKLDTPDREHSVRQLINRVTKTITEWGIKGKYFSNVEDANAFYNELSYLLVNQYLSFNSPVWFNVGIEKHPQCSACFINSVEDKMESILELAKTEGMLFKWGSGTGTNLSVLRSSKESLSGGGIASGPVSFMKGYDAFAGVIKSGGKTRRAAKMVILNIDHPDIIDFINCKADEEKKAHALIEAGYDSSFNVPGGAYDSIHYQNANHSIRVTDEFMDAVVNKKSWQTKAIKDGRVIDTFDAEDVMNKVAQAAWLCGDPGIQFDTTINNWHTCSNSARINASNPCSEYMFLDDTACNLASLNLMKFRNEDGNFDVDSFRHVCSIVITAQEILVENSSYPTKAIEKNSYDYRPLGLGYANLGALLMANGVAYDSDHGRAYAAAITSIMCGVAYKQSAIISEKIGPFRGFLKNREPMLRIMNQHLQAAKKIDGSLIPLEMFTSSIEIWEEVAKFGTEFGFRNSQVTVLAPTGTIGFMMDCDTTGVEPDIALVKMKKLVGGGAFKIINKTVPLALNKLGYNSKQVAEIVSYINESDTIEGAPHLLEEHLPIFDCAFKPVNGSRTIHYMGHIKMMSAVQPFLSGAISKTVNMPNEVRVEEIKNSYLEAWRLGLKAIAIYRDGCKVTQPLSTSTKTEKKKIAEEKGNLYIDFQPRRKRLPDERHSITHKFSISGHEGYITVGIYEDGQPGEIFIVMSKEGTVVSGLMDSFATAISLALQYGVPLKVLVDKFTHTRFEPSGFTNNKQIPIAKSVMDYIFRWLQLKFLPEDEASQLAQIPEYQAKKSKTMSKSQTKMQNSLEFNEKKVFVTQADAPPCHECGSIMVRSGNCYKCLECGSTSGCS